MSYNVFVTGGTGYIGSRLIPLLAQRGHTIRALVRQGSETRLPSGCKATFGNALDQCSFEKQVQPAHTFIQLVGAPYPSPAKSEQFKAVDLASVRASVGAAATAGIQHFIYISVAHPAPIMKEYIAVRSEGEDLIRRAGLNATIVRPWYVLGPGHRWPILLLPVYWLLACSPGTRDSARRLGLVTLRQMLGVLAAAVDSPASGIRILEAPAIRRGTV